MNRRHRRRTRTISYSAYNRAQWRWYDVLGWCLVGLCIGGILTLFVIGSIEQNCYSHGVYVCSHD